MKLIERKQVGTLYHFTYNGNALEMDEPLRVEQVIAKILRN